MTWQDTLVFNQPLNLDTSSVTDMSLMLLSALAFDQPLNFDTSSVTRMDHMFLVLRSGVPADPPAFRWPHPARHTLHF